LEAAQAKQALVQPVAIAYTRRGGLPLDRRERGAIAWIGEMDFLPHFKALLRAGALDVELGFGAPIPFAADADRKQVARASEAEVRRMLVAALRQHGREREDSPVF